MAKLSELKERHEALCESESVGALEALAEGALPYIEALEAEVDRLRAALVKAEDALVFTDEASAKPPKGYEFWDKVFPKQPANE